MNILLVKQDVDGDIPLGRIKNISKHVNIGKHVHHHSNNLEKKHKRKIVKPKMVSVVMCRECFVAAV